MKLRLKVLIILASVWALIYLIIFTYSKYTLMADYKKQEVKDVIDDLDRVNKTLLSIFSSLKLLNNDWAQWNDAYRFMQDKNKAFITSNLSFTTFENSKINLILFFNKEGKLFYGLNYDLNTKKFIPIPQKLLNRLESEKSFSHQTNAGFGKMGILKLNGDYVVLSALPILTSEGKGPIQGTLIMGYFLNERHLAQLSDIVKMDVQLFTLPIPKDNPQLITAYDHLNTEMPYYIAVQNSKIINGYTLIRDIEKRPIGILGIQVPRVLYNEGVKTIHSYLTIMIGIGIFFLFSVWYLLKIFVLDRILSIGNQVIDINSQSKFSRRIQISGKDELANMVSAINSLMEIIELTEEQLKYRIFLRTEELERLSKLNKNLYAEMNNQKQVEVKLREGEKTLRHMAYYDSLTGLPNRLFLFEILQKSINKSAREGTGIAILFMDADKFKSINDTYGHDIGDKFLRHAAQQLKASIKDSDIAARLSGDEFIICLNNIRGKSLIANEANQILKNVSVPLKINQIEIYSTFSMGIAIFPEDGTTIEELEKNADLAMYYAKKQPDTSFCFYDEIAKGVSTNY